MGDVRVRPATIADAPSVARVHVESWRSAYGGLVPNEYIDSLTIDRRREVWEEILGNASADQGLLVLEASDSIVGFCHFSPTRDDDAPPGTGEITAIYLLSSHWGRGGGSLLLAEASQALTAAGFERATLWVLEGNERAQRFYSRHGWHPDGSTKVEDRGPFRLREVRYVRSLRMVGERQLPTTAQGG